MAKQEVFVKRKEYLFSELTRIMDATKKSLSELDADVQLRACTRLEGSFEKITEEIITFNAQVDAAEQVSTKDFSSMRTLIDSIVRNCLKAKMPKGSSSTVQREVDRDESALPKINLPMWDGEIATWIDFKAQFDSLIGSRANLSGVCKLQYLRASLKGEPSSIVNQYPLSEDSYELAYNDLVHRYENKRRLASYYLSRILNFKASNSNSGREHINFIEVHRAATSALNRLRINLSDFLLFELCYRNLQPRDRKRFDLEHDSSTIPKLQDLLSFFEKVARAEELFLDQEPSSSHKGDDRKGKSTAIKRSLVTAKQQRLCYYCKGDHMLFRCQEILSLPPDARKARIEQLGCCVACLYKHPKKDCKSKFCCKTCGSKKHNTILHSDEKTPGSNPSSQESYSKFSSESKSCNNCTTPGCAPAVLLGTIQCRVRDNWGKEICIRAILDPGSEISVITSSLASRLGLLKSPATCRVEGIGRNVRKPLGNVHIKISSFHSPQTEYELQAAVLPKICDQLPKSRLSLGSLERFDSLQLADPYFRQPGEIHLLLGAEAYSDLLTDEEPSVIPGNPAAIRTKFGYVIIGRSQDPHHGTLESAISLCISTSPLDESLRRFWEVEEATHEIPPDPEDALCEKHFQETHQRDSTGRFVVRLPFRSDSTPLKSNEVSAMRRLKSLERRLEKNPDLFRAYQDCLEEYIKLGHISRTSEEASYLLPHHAVFKESSSTTKCRIVFDCSAPDISGISLNDRLYRGPPLLNDISALLINFRFFKTCLMADIKMMYRMVCIHPDDRENLVIVWKGERYRMNRLPFGLKPAGYIAGRCIQELAHIHQEEFPDAARAIREHRYADDFLTGADSVEDARKLRVQLTELLSRGGFEIRRWSSNTSETLSDVPESFKETPVKLPSGEKGIKVLGVMWDQSNDAFVARVVPFESASITKRTVLSYIAKIYDILGFFSPTVFLAKQFIQRLWLLELDWDQPLPSSLADEWIRYSSDLVNLVDIKIPRFLPIRPNTFRLVGFADASEKGMAAVVYIQWGSVGSVQQGKLIKSKTKLAPLKTLTIPRLELCAALLLTRIIRPVIDWSGIFLESVHLYTDSRVVLAWLEHSPHELKTFVGNRVSEIQRNVPSAVWNHVDGSENPADLGSRGLSASLLKSSRLWWDGPSFLSQPQNEWPMKARVNERTPELKEAILSEVKNNLVLNSNEKEPLDSLLLRFSSFTKMQRVIAYVWRFKQKTQRSKGCETLNGPLSLEELRNSLHLAVGMSQREFFGSDINKIKEGKPVAKQLQKLSPFVDKNTGLVRVGGRLGRASFLPEDAKHPFLLPKGCHLSSLICDHFHQLYFHSGPRTTCAAIQRKFWIMSLMSLVKSRIHRCRRCHRLSSRPIQPLMADVIPGRLDTTYCWVNCAIDFAGPFSTRESNLRKSTLHKSYICTFVCLTTKAVHLEMVSDLTTKAFLAALSRFAARRSVPRVIYSDRGTNFVGARTVLREISDFLISEHDKIFSAAAAIGISWKLNAPYSPNFNGCAESSVKSIKSLIKRQVGDQILTFEEFSTLLCRVEQILNSRPISFSSRDINDRDIVYLTPGHFITGREMMTPPEKPMEEELTLGDRWRRVQQMSQRFWKLWSISYLHELMQRAKWQKAVKNLQVGDIVYVSGISTTPLSWPIGRVVETLTNPDDETVRVVRVRVRGRDIIRPANKLVRIPTD